MKIFAVQYDIEWHNPEENFKKIETLLQNKALKGSLVVLPEMFNTGYTMKPAETVHTASLTSEWMSAFSATHGCLIAGSIPTEENGKYFNRMYVYAEGKKLAQYDKRHLFSNAGEDKIYSAGNSISVFEYGGMRIKAAICYDLRFPVWLRNTERYDLLLIVANWPAKRAAVWETLLKARAIENQAYVAGINRTGKDENGFVYNGGSMIIDAKGNILAKCTEDETVCETTVSKIELEEFRNKFDTLKDVDNFKIIL